MKRILLSILMAGILLLGACAAPATVREAEAPPAPTTHTLSVSVSPLGAGSVSPPGGEYEPGLQVTLTATPANGYTFDYWDGAASGSSHTTTITMDSNKSITAHFKVAETPPAPPTTEQAARTTYTLSVSVSPSGAGSVSPPSGEYEPGLQMTLTATPASGYTFDYWDGAASGSSHTTTITMDSNKSATAHFKEKEVATYSLSVSVQPAGSGSVTPSSGDYLASTDVTLVATAAPGYEFDHWSGDTSDSSPTTTITMASNRSIIAHFKVIEPAVGLSRDNPLPMGESLITPEGIEITVVNLIKGNQAWEIIHEANMFNDPPASGMQYIIITVKVKNISSEEEPESVSDWDFELIGSSNKVFHGTERSVVLPDEGSLSGLWVDLYHGGKETGSLDFYVPADETNLVLIWDCSYNIFKENKRFFEVR